MGRRGIWLGQLGTQRTYPLMANSRLQTFLDGSLLFINTAGGQRTLAFQRSEWLSQGVARMLLYRLDLGRRLIGDPASTKKKKRPIFFCGLCGPRNIEKGSVVQRVLEPKQNPK